jgi:7,8-dihydro-6-hydroxymethylpterin-pyrophosphokinase
MNTQNTQEQKNFLNFCLALEQSLKTIKLIKYNAKQFIFLYQKENKTQ